MTGGGTSADPAGLAEPAGRAEPAGLAARTMALAGTTVIAALALLMLLITSLPGGSPGSGGDAAIRAASGGSPGGPACVAATDDLLCNESAQASGTTVTIHDPVISVAGPGSVSLDDPTLMIDGNRNTSWQSGGDATGSSILLQFNEPIRVGAVGLASAPADAAASRRVASMTWSFGSPKVNSKGYCGASGDQFGREFHQSLGQGPTMKIFPPVTTCTVRLRLDRLTAVNGSGASTGGVAISELILRAG